MLELQQSTVPESDAESCENTAKFKETRRRAIYDVYQKIWESGGCLFEDIPVHKKICSLRDNPATTIDGEDKGKNGGRKKLKKYNLHYIKKLIQKLKVFKPKDRSSKNYSEVSKEIGEAITMKLEKIRNDALGALVKISECFQDKDLQTRKTERIESMRTCHRRQEELRRFVEERLDMTSYDFSDKIKALVKEVNTEKERINNEIIKERNLIDSYLLEPWKIGFPKDSSKES